MKIIINEYDFLTYDVILKSGDNIISKDENLNEMEAESCLLALYYDYKLPKRTKVINHVYKCGELEDTYKMTFDELFPDDCE